MRCDIGGALKSGINGISFGKYSFLPLPKNQSGEFKTELLLNFTDEWEEGQIGSNPEKEGEIILSFLSLVLKQKIKLNSVRLNDIQIDSLNDKLIIFDSPINQPETLANLHQKFRSLPLDLLERYLRACECYQQALLISNNNPSISFFLFVASIECLSNKEQDFYLYLKDKLNDNETISKESLDKFYESFNNGYGLKKNFIKFIVDNYSGWNSYFSEEEFKKLLSSIYDIRSSFTHKGENLEKYISFVDKTLKSKSVFTRIKEKKVEFPGLNYLSEIVQKAILNSLDKQNNEDCDNIPELALNEGKIDLEVDDGLSIKKGEFVSTNQIKHRK
jgi:hypothetical protein